MLSHSKFVEDYKAGKIQVLFNQHVANHLVESPFADKHNKPAHYFWIYLAFGLSFIAPIALLFINWLYSVGAFILGRMIWGAAKKSAADFASQNMLDDEKFYEHAIRQPGVTITDSNGGQLQT